MCSVKCWALCCAVLSPVGVVFLGVLAALCYSGSTSVEIKETLKHERGTSSLVAAGLYAAIFAVSLVYLLMRSRARKSSSVSASLPGNLAPVTMATKRSTSGASATRVATPSQE